MTNDIAWNSFLTAEMVAKLNGQELSLLINELDDAVAQICESYEIE
jgi:hypothetical protein